MSFFDWSYKNNLNQNRFVKLDLELTTLISINTKEENSNTIRLSIGFDTSIVSVNKIELYEVSIIGNNKILISAFHFLLLINWELQ